MNAHEMAMILVKNDETKPVEERQYHLDRDGNPVVLSHTRHDGPWQVVLTHTPDDGNWYIYNYLTKRFKKIGLVLTPRANYFDTAHAECDRRNAALKKE